jgi:hypothetical protein
MEPIILVGLDVNPAYLKPGTYLVASYMNDEAEQYSPHEWIFKLDGCLQMTYNYLEDTASDGEFAMFDGSAWRIFYVGRAGRQMNREFSDLVVLEVT